jgi:hypothetical protein
LSFTEMRRFAFADPIWTPLLRCNSSSVNSVSVVPSCNVTSCDPPAMNEMASFVINTTHSLMCGGLAPGSAYPLEFVTECYIFSEVEQRFVSRITSPELGRTSAPLWITGDLTAYFWSGAGDVADFTDYIFFNLTNPLLQYPFFSSGRNCRSVT